MQLLDQLFGTAHRGPHRGGMETEVAGHLAGDVVVVEPRCHAGDDVAERGLRGDAPRGLEGNDDGPVGIEGAPAGRGTPEHAHHGVPDITDAHRTPHDGTGQRATKLVRDLRADHAEMTPRVEPGNEAPLHHAQAVEIGKRPGGADYAHEGGRHPPEHDLRGVDGVGGGGAEAGERQHPLRVGKGDRDAALSAVTRTQTNVDDVGAELLELAHGLEARDGPDRNHAAHRGHPDHDADEGKGGALLRRQQPCAGFGEVRTAERSHSPPTSPAWPRRWARATGRRGCAADAGTTRPPRGRG